jgi:hypothetical protein
MYKLDLKDFPKKVVEAMLYEQELQGNPRDVSAFEYDRRRGRCNRGFDWCKTKNDWLFWRTIIEKQKFNHIVDHKK